MESIKKEQKAYVELPKLYNFGDEKDKILTENFRRINEEVKQMCETILGKQL